MISNLEKMINEAKQKLMIGNARMATLTKQKEEYEDKISKVNVVKLEKTGLVLQKLAEDQRELAKKHLEELATRALRYSMGTEDRVELEVDNTRKRPQASLWIVNDETGLRTDPLEENGGGIVDIVGLALGIISLQTNEPIINGPIIFDEPFKMVSKEYVPMLVEFIQKISVDFGRQIIMVTHNQYLSENISEKIEI